MRLAFRFCHSGERGIAIRKTVSFKNAKPLCITPGTPIVTDHMTALRQQIRKALFQKGLPFKRLWEVYRNIIPAPLYGGQIIMEAYWRHCDQRKFFFIQVGSNDGIIDDPLYRFIKKYDWRGILLEPLPHVFTQLVHNHRASRQVLPENAAISSASGSQTFYRLRETQDKAQSLHHQKLSTFNKDVIYKYRDSIADFDNLIVEEQVRTITFDELTEKHQVSQVDLLHVDVEGYDYEILKNFNFSRFSPALILFEYKHLNRNDYLAAINYLKDRKYEVYRIDADDLLCIRTDLRELTALAGKRWQPAPL